VLRLLTPFRQDGSCAVSDTKKNNLLPWSRSGELLYGATLFVGAIAALAITSPASGIAADDWHTVLFFLGFGLFTISIGYDHPYFGYLSFDRVAQVSAILVLGPVDAASTRRDETTVRALLQHADTCLYRAKHLGRNRVEVRDQPMPPAAT